MKILFLTNYLQVPQDTGTKIRSYNFIKYFTAKGRVTVICPAKAADAAHVAELEQLCEKVVWVDDAVFGPACGAGERLNFAERLRLIPKGIPWSLVDFISQDFKGQLLALRPETFDLIFIRYPQMA